MTLQHLKTTYQPIFDFEHMLEEFTGAPFAILTTGCTHAMELCLRYQQITKFEQTAYTYISVLHMYRQLGIDYTLTDEKWVGEYKLHGTNIWDSARKLTRGMYRPGDIQCLSFGINKPLTWGTTGLKMGAILLDDREAWNSLHKMRSDGRDLYNFRNTGPKDWAEQEVFEQAYHYMPTLTDCNKAIELMDGFEGMNQEVTDYPDCRTLVFK